MSSHIVPFGLIWGSVALLAALTLLAWRQQPERGSTLFAVTMFCGIWWAAASALGLFATADATKVFWAKVEWAGIAFIPVGWLLFSLQYTGREKYVSVRSMLWLSVIPVTTVALAMTNALHGLVYQSTTKVSAGPLTVLDVQFGPWFWFQSLYGYALLLAGTVLIVQLAVENRNLYLDQVVALLFVLIPPFVASVAYLFSIGPFHALDPTPYTFVLSGVAGIVALKRYRFLDAVPVTDRVARQSLVDEMEQGVVVVDSNDDVVEMNPTARRLFGGETASIGVDASTVVPEYHRIAADGPDDRVRIPIERDSQERIYEVQVTNLEAGSGSGSGAVLVFHDVTEQRTHLQRLDVLNRVLRHNLRNEMNVVYGYADQIENQPQDPGQIAAQIKEKALAMTTIGDRAREIDDILKDGRDADQTATLPTLLQWERARIARDHPEVAVEYRSPSSAAECPTAMETVLKILVEEVIDHNDGADPTVTIEASVSETDATVTISDDGPGIPASERRVFESGEETELRHGSGLGLWLANWGVQAIGGDLAITDEASGGTAVEITVPCTGGAERPSPAGQ